MGLSEHPVAAQIAVSDLERATGFYEGVLALERTGDSAGGNPTYACGRGTTLHVYVSPENAGTATGTVAQWIVDDLAAVVAELTAAGVGFEHYGEPVATDARGIHDSGYGAVAWFRDPDGNTFALEQAT